MVNERPVVSTSGALFMARFVSYIHVNQKIKTMFISPAIGPYQVIFGLPEQNNVIVLN